MSLRGIGGGRRVSHHFTRLWSLGRGNPRYSPSAPRSMTLTRVSAGFFTIAMLAGIFTGVVATAASATTKVPVSLNMTAGTFATQGGSPGAVPVIATPVFTGKETTKTGKFTTATFKFPTQHHHTPTPTTPTTTQPLSTETIFVSTAPSTTVSGLMTTAGNFSIVATLLYRVKITKPVTQTCVTTSPVHVVLASTVPYTASAKTVTVKNSGITIPTFKATGCSLAHGSLSKTFSGPGGELGLSLHGTLVVPSSGTPTATTLTTTPASPQLVGTTVTVKATVKKTTGGPATGATGSVTFKNGTTALGSVALASNGTASFKTNALPIGTNSLTVIYSGGGGYAGSTSSPVVYSIRAKPTVTVTNLPAKVTGLSTTWHTFTATVTNPSNGITFTHLFLTVSVNIYKASTSLAQVQYERATSLWCTPVAYHTSGATVLATFAGTGATCTVSYPASFSSTSGSKTTAHFRVRFPATSTPTYPTTGLFGQATFTASLFTGTCSSSSTCTAVAPFTGFTVPKGSATMAVIPPSPFPTTSIFNGRIQQKTVRKTFALKLETNVKPTKTSTTGTYYLGAPRGTVSYSIDGSQVATQPLTAFAATVGNDYPSYFGTTTLSVGPHQMEITFNPATYAGLTVFEPSSYTFTFTVVTAPTGTPFVCAFGGFHNGTVNAYVTNASATVPKAVPAVSTTSAPISAGSLTLVIDPVLTTLVTTDPTATVGASFSPTGSGAAAPSFTFPTPSLAATTMTLTMSGLSSSVPVTKGTPPGTVITIGVDDVYAAANIFSMTCRPPRTGGVSAPVTSTEIAGTTLSVSPSSPVTSGTAVTLTANVIPAPTSGGTSSQVQFFDGSTSLGTKLVSTSGADRGTASITVKNLSAGGHSLSASWSGTPGNNIPFSVSNTVPFTVNPGVVTKPVVTTQPTNQMVMAGQTATFSAAASGTPKPAVQWQVEAAGSSTWADVTGAMSTSLSFSAEVSQSGNKYRAVFTNSGGTATTTAATLTVNPATPSSGYWQVAQDGGLFSFGSAQFYGSMGGKPLNEPIVGMAVTPTGKGYWEVASDGGLFSFGSAQFYGSMGGKPLNEPIVGMAVTPTGKGYWEVASDGGLFSFGSAQFYGSMGGKPLNEPIVGMAVTPTGKGYWEVASDGGLFSFGSAQFYGSMGGKPLNEPIVGMAVTPTGKGYWEVASDGGLFSFGNVSFYGSTGGIPLSKPIVGMAATPTGGGYYEVASDGGLFTFGNAGFDGSLGGTPLDEPIVGVAVA